MNVLKRIDYWLLRLEATFNLFGSVIVHKLSKPKREKHTDNIYSGSSSNDFLTMIRAVRDINPVAYSMGSRTVNTTSTKKPKAISMSGNVKLKVKEKRKTRYEILKKSNSTGPR